MISNYYYFFMKKAHYIRALALSDLSRYEEALYEICLAIGMDKSANLSNTELFQHDLTKVSNITYNIDYLIKSLKNIKN